MANESRYIVGIDLGTTNCALAYVDTAVSQGQRQVEVLEIPQLVAPGEVRSLPVLPSFVYLPEPHEVKPEMLFLPWTRSAQDYAVGAWARDMASRVPGKVVNSAKSWLCYEGIDRRAPVLPWDRKAVPRQVSPVEASQLYLEHFRNAWNHVMAASDPDLRMENQDVILTVPASFDAVARELTVEAATRAGLEVRLLEEPQAAFYAWLHEHEQDWRDLTAAGDIILVCDIGGGTTDLSLIAVKDVGGNLQLERIAVGDHILLGGDNMDLTLAYNVASKLEREQGVKLDAYQLAGLAHGCRRAKEELGSDERPQPLTVLGRSSGVIGGTISTELTAEEMDEYLMGGFFPICEISDKPAERRKIGLRTFGLDYASDPAVTRHLAAFLRTHSVQNTSGRLVLPSVVLFNGGVNKSAALRERILEALRKWNTAEKGEITVISGADPDLAVGLGAAWYGNVQREGGVRIKSGSARSYYIGIEAAMPAVPGMAAPIQALCVTNFGLEEGSSVRVPAEGIGLVVGEPTEFRFFSSTRRQDDKIGDVLESWEETELNEMPQLVAELPVEENATSSIGTLVPVELETVLTEIGTLQLWCHDKGSGRRWKLEFELRQEQGAIQE